MREDISHHLQVIQRYRDRFSSLNSWEIHELESAQEEIRRIQSRCYHQFYRLVLFSSERWVCELCAHEEPLPSTHFQ